MRLRVSSVSFQMFLISESLNPSDLYRAYVDSVMPLGLPEAALVTFLAGASLAAARVRTALFVPSSACFIASRFPTPDARGARLPSYISASIYRWHRQHADGSRDCRQLSSCIVQRQRREHAFVAAQVLHVLGWVVPYALEPVIVLEEGPGSARRSSSRGSARGPSTAMRKNQGIAGLDEPAAVQGVGGPSVLKDFRRTPCGQNTRACKVG